MQAHSIATNKRATCGHALDARRLGQISLGFAVMLLLFTSSLFLLRRLSGGMDVPLDALNLILLASACGLLFAIARKAWLRIVGAPRHRGWIVGHWFPLSLSATVVLGGAAFSLPGTPTLALCAFWAILIGCEAWGWWHDGPTRDRALVGLEFGRLGIGQSDSALQDVAVEQAETQLDGWDDSEDVDSECLPPGMTQRIVRTIDEAGRQLIYGTLRCDFAIGERQRFVHLAFCPPLAGKPALSVDQVDGATARLKVAQLESFGAGVEVKLQSLSNSPESVQLQFYAHETQVGPAT